MSMNDKSTLMPGALPRNHRGVALVTGMVFTVALAVTGMTVLSLSIQDDRMVSNQRLQTDAFLAADAGLVSARASLNEELESTALDCDDYVDNPYLAEDFSGGGDRVGRYIVSVLNCDDSIGKIELSSEGQVVDSAGNGSVSRELVAEYYPPSAGGPLPSDAPAAVSCFGGECSIHAGAGGGADQGFGLISGYDHPEYTGGGSANDRRLTPKDDSQAGVPAVFLEEKNGSSITTQAGKEHYCGLAIGGSVSSCSSGGTDSSIVWDGSAYEAGQEPTQSEYFGDTDWSALVNSESGDGSTSEGVPVFSHNDLGGFTNGVAVVDEEGVSFGGNDIHNGLIIITNCGTLTVNGNPNIYGAVMVDATGCGPEYNPFTGNGTPAVRFSRDALSSADDLMPGGSGSLTGWEEWISQ